MYTRKVGPVHESAHMRLVEIAGGSHALKTLLQVKPFGENELLDRFLNLKLWLEGFMPKNIVRIIPEKFILRISVRMYFE